MKHLELVELWNSAHTAWAADQPLPDELEAWRASYSGKGKSAIDKAAMPEPWVGDLASKPVAVTMGIHPGVADPAFQHREGAWPNTIQDQHDGSYADWAATGPYFGDVWESAHGVNVHSGHRMRFLSAWTGKDLMPSQVVDFTVYPWHAADWKTNAFKLDPEVLREYVLEPIASTGATWAFGFGKDWWELIEALDLPILDRLGDGGRPYPTQVDHRRWLVAEGPDGLRIAAMRMDSMPIPPTKEETEDLRRVLESGPAGENRKRNMSIELESDLAARLREMDMSYMNITRLMLAIDDVELAVDSWQADEKDDGVALVYRDDVVVTIQPEWADFMTEAPAGTSVSPGTEGNHRLPLPPAATGPAKTTRKVTKEPKPLGMCPECFNVLNPDGSCPMECGE
ncbi:MAG: hypothetical protein WA964_13815 [Ilumatobacter sp.]|uniref:hypothetical protein n=1 Tax=Ilumatobacter sp. TaxID=1967498 RepID=UPI003C733B97